MVIQMKRIVEAIVLRIYRVIYQDSGENYISNMFSVSVISIGLSCAQHFSLFGRNVLGNSASKNDSWQAEMSDGNKLMTFSMDVSRILIW